MARRSETRWRVVVLGIPFGSLPLDDAGPSGRLDTERAGCGAPPARAAGQVTAVRDATALTCGNTVP
ncbi:hypothetical protein GCM10020256_32070 [Streptomyces thermocoprophilus]